MLISFFYGLSYHQVNYPAFYEVLYQKNKRNRKCSKKRRIYRCRQPFKLSGRFLKFYESIPVDSEKSWNHEKTNKIALENASHFLKKGDIIGIFPEGSRSHNGILQKAKTGIAKLALLAGV